MEVKADNLSTILFVFNRFAKNHPALAVSYTLLDSQVLQVLRDGSVFGTLTLKEGIIEFDPKLAMSRARPDGILTESDIRNWIEQARFADIT
jgi:hypothetical protein